MTSVIQSNLVSLLEVIEKGGTVMLALIVLSVVLYERCFHLYLTLRSSRRVLRQGAEDATLDELRLHQDRLQDYFSESMIKIRPMVAAAPLMGLLGTVIGMVEMFESLGHNQTAHTIKGLSDGISKALITTETGLAIAIPAAVILYFAQRQLNGATHVLIAREQHRMEAAAG